MTQKRQKGKSLGCLSGGFGFREASDLRRRASGGFGFEPSRGLKAAPFREKRRSPRPED
jgi:hypothetical protein